MGAEDKDPDSLTVLFWNLAGKDLGDQLSTLAVQQRADIIAVCEAKSLSREFLPNSPAAWAEAAPIVAGHKIRLFFRGSNFRVQRVHEHGLERIIIARIILKHTELLLAVVHLGSKASWSHNHLFAESLVIAGELRKVEARFRHRRTIAVGDFNMNPYEPGMMAAAGFHAVMTKRLALNEDRTVQEETYPFFYNPMWGCFGDRTPGPSGTYFFRNSDQLAPCHHIFDQVLLRPSLLSSTPERVHILETCGDAPLCDDKGRPDRVRFSDHLPVVFETCIPRTTKGHHV